MGAIADYSDPYYPGNGEEDGEWNVFSINPYIGAFSKTYDPWQDCGTSRLVACPSTDSEFMAAWCRMNCESEWGFIELSYSFWVIGPLPTPVEPGYDCSEHVLEDLTLDTLSPNRLVMSDVMAIDNWGGVGDPYIYNHGRTGWAWFTADVIGHTIYDPYPKATGRNQVFGDGHFEWRAISAEYEDNLPNTNDVGYLEDRWNGAGSGWMNYGDVSYY
jgi:hypothetical protein